MKMVMKLIYSVEDDESIKELIKYALESAGFEVLSFDNAEDMLKVFAKQKPELVILDIMLPIMDGIEALKLIRSDVKNKDIKIVMLTAKTSEANKLVGLDSGADDYITKPFSVLELVARVKAHLRNTNQSCNAPQIFKFKEITLDDTSRTALLDKTPVDLTFKEFELLKMLMKNAGKVINREEFLNQIWGYEYYGESRTVDIHIKNLRAKLGEYGEYIVGVRSIGYILKGSDEKKY